MKKILSLFLAVAVIAVSMFAITASAETITAGSYPYAATGSTYEPVITTEEGVTAREDFVVKSNLDNLEDGTFYNTWKPNNTANTSFTNNSGEYYKATLCTETANVYGGSGKSFHVAYGKPTYTTVKPADLNSAIAVSFVRVNTQYTIPDAENGGVGFWVKTANPVYMVVRLTANVSGSTAHFIVSDRLAVPVGESFVEIPLSNFETSNDGFTLKTDGSAVIYNTDIYFVRQDTESDTRDIYIDHLGYYNYPDIPEIPTTPATHKDGFTEVELNSAKWINKKAETSTIDTVDNAAFSHSGTTNVSANTSALKVDYSSISATEKLVNFYYNDLMRLSTEAPYIYETDSGIAFWVRADQPVDLVLTYVDYNTGTAKGEQVKSVRRSVPAGESIVEIPMSEFAREGYTFDYRYTYQFQIYVYSNADSYATSGTLYFDAFGFYDIDPTNNIPDTSEPEPPVDPGTQVKHREGFTEKVLSDTYWRVGVAATDTYTLDKNATDKYCTETSDTKSVKLSYTTAAATGTEFIRLANDVTFQNPIGRNASIAFWVYTTQEVELGLLYVDRTGQSVSEGQITTPVYKTVVPAGEHIIEVDITRFDKEGKTMAYNWLNQWQWRVYGTENTTSATGDIYFDAVGFYDIGVDGDMNFDRNVDIVELVKLHSVATAATLPDDITPYNFFKDGFANYRDEKLVRDYILKGSELFEEPTLRTDATFIGDADWLNGSWSSDRANLGKCTVEDESLGYYAGDSDTKAVRFDYTGIGTTSEKTERALFILNNEEFSDVYGSQSGFSFYAKADQPLKLVVQFKFSEDNTTGAALSVELKKGDNFINIPISTQYNGATELTDWTIKHIQFGLNIVSSSTTAEGTVYIDSLGIYDIDPNRDESFVFQGPDSETKGKWLTNGNYSEDPLSSSARTLVTGETYYALDGDTESIKLNYNATVAAGDKQFANLYYHNSSTGIEPTYKGNSGISVYIYADRTIKLNMLMSFIESGKNSTAKEYTLNEGWNCINVPLSDFVDDSWEAELTNYTINDIQFRFYPQVGETGTIYFDSFGFFDCPQ